MEEIIDFSKLPIEEIKGDINLFLFNNCNVGLKELKETNKLIERLKDVKLQISFN